MPGSSQPTASSMRIDPLLSGISVAFHNEEGGYVADQVFPILPTREKSGKIAEYNKDAFFRNFAKLRAPGTVAELGNFRVTTQSFNVENYAAAFGIADEDRRIVQDPFDLDRDATFLVVEAIKLLRESKFATDFFGDVWGTNNTTATDWDDFANSAPVEDVSTAQETIYNNTARMARQMLINHVVWFRIRNHPDFIERIKYTQRAVLTLDLVASLMDLDRILVGRALEVSSKEGQTVTLGKVFGDHALVFHRPERPGLRTPAAGYTIHWTGISGGPTFVRRVREERPMVDIIEGHTWFDQKQISSALGYRFQSIV